MQPSELGLLSERNVVIHKRLMLGRGSSLEASPWAFLASPGSGKGQIKKHGTCGMGRKHLEASPLSSGTRDAAIGRMIRCVLFKCKIEKESNILDKSLDLKSRPRRNFPPWVLSREMTLCAGRPILNTIVNPADLQSPPCEQRHHQNLVYQRRWLHRRVLRHSRKK